MPLSVESGAALIPGATLSKEARHVRVVRPFMAGGQVIHAGADLTLPAVFAAELVGAGKAVYLAPATIPATAAAEAPNKVKPAKPAKESPDAR